MRSAIWLVLALAGIPGCLSSPPMASDDESPSVDAPPSDATEPPDMASEPPPPDPACPVEHRDVCAPGACIDESAGGCVAQVCEDMPSCCDTAWSPACAALASTRCASCGHAPVIGAYQFWYITERAGAWPVRYGFEPGLGGWRLEYHHFAWADHDNDGDADLALVGGCDAAVFDNLGAPGAVALGVPTWIDLDGGEPGCAGDPAPGFGGHAIAWGDVDRDGDLDLAVGGSRGLAVIVQAETGWTLEPLPPPADLGPGQIHGINYVAWLDVDADHRVDLVIGRDQQMMLYRNTAGVLAPGAWNGPTFVTRGATCDLDSDGDEELIVASDLGYLTLLDASVGVFTMSGPIDAHARAVACGDLDGDGLPELVSSDDLYATGTTVPGHLRIWRRASLRDPFVEVWTSTDTYRNYGGVAIADDEGDGDLDILFPAPGPEPGFVGAWFHMLENTTPIGGTLSLVDVPGRYLPANTGVNSYGASWMPLTAARF